MKKKVIRNIKIIIDVVGILAIIFLIYLFVTTYRGNVPNIFGYHFLRVVSSSMEPVISEGDCIISKSTDTDKIKKGDIITFFSEDPAIYNYLNTHRVEGIIDNPDGTREFITKGDANKEQDLYSVREEKILGVYVGDVFLGKAISKGFELLSDRKVYFAVVILPILVCLSISIIDVFKIFFGDEETET